MSLIKPIIILFFVFISIAYSDTPESIEIINNLWNELSNNEACLTGGQYCIEGKCDSEGCCLTEDKKWKSFLKINENDIVPFLISQISDTSISVVHVCPYDNALKGELAVYCLQHIFKLNWYEIFEIVDTNYTIPDSNQLQEKLREILKSDADRSKLIDLWNVVYKGKFFSKTVSVKYTVKGTITSLVVGYLLVAIFLVPLFPLIRCLRKKDFTDFKKDLIKNEFYAFIVWLIIATICVILQYYLNKFINVLGRN
jgi:hypothetical protein